MTKFSALFLFLFLFFAARVSAQFSDSVHYFINYTSTGSVNKTNDGDTYLLNNGLRFSVRKKDLTLNTSGSWIYGAQQSKLNNNDFTSTLDFNLYKTLPHFYYWGLGNYTTSYSLKINNQVQGGLGIAYNVADNEEANLNISNGILYERGDLVKDTTREIYQVWRNSLRLQFRFNLHKIVTLQGNGLWQQSFSDSNDYSIKTSVALSVKLRRWLSLSSAFNYNRFNRTDRENMLLTYGITFEHYF